MVRRDMADAFHMELLKPLRGIIIMKIRNSLIGLAAEFSQIMSHRCTGRQCHIDRHTGVIKTAGYGHRHVVYTGDMTQGLKRGRLAVETHHLINILISKFTDKMCILVSTLAAGILFLCQ